MKKINIILALALAFFVGGCKEKPEPVGKEAVKIGFILPLSGKLAHLGESLRDAALMAKEDEGKTKLSYQFIFEDGQANARVTATAIQKLINVDKVDAVVSFSSTSGNVINPVAEKAEVVHLAVATDPKIASGKFNFIHWTPNQRLAEGMAKVLSEKKFRKVAVFVSNAQGPLSLLDAFEKSVKGTGIEIVFRSKQNVGERDFRIAVNESRQADPDIYLLLCIPPELEIITKQLREQGVALPVTSMAAFNISPEPSIFEGSWFIDGADITEEMKARFREKYGHKDAKYVGNIYDVVKMIVHVSEQSPQKPSSKEIANALLRIENFEGAVGAVSIDDQGIVQSRATLQEIRGGKSVIIKRDL